MEDENKQKLLDFQLRQQFLELYVRNERRIYVYIYTLVHDWTTAEDLLQETAVILWTQFEQFKPETNFAAWSLTIAKFQVLKYLKKNKSQKVQFDNNTIEMLATEIQDYSSTHDIRQEALKKCLKKLPAKDLKLLELRYEVSSTVCHAAQWFGKSVSAIYQSLNRIHRQLFYCIKKHMNMDCN